MVPLDSSLMLIGPRQRSKKTNHHITKINAMRKARKGQAWREFGGRKRELAEARREKKRPGPRCPGRLEEGVSELLLAGVERKFLRADHLAVQGAGNERLALGFAGLGVGDGDLIDFQRASDGALVIGLGFGEVGQSAEFRALCVDEVALCLNDELYGGCSELILFLLRIKRLLLQFAGLAGGLDLSAILRQRDVGVADVEQRGVLQLL